MEEDRLYGYDGPDSRREPVEEGLTPAEGLAGAGERPVNTEEGPANIEEGRANVEESRATAEESRATAEESRATAEESPVTAEESRATAEESPVTAEESPANAEKELANAEEDSPAAPEEPAAEDAADRYDTQNSGTGSDFHELNGYPDTGSRQYESWGREEYRQNDNWQQDNRERGDWQQDNWQQDNRQQNNYQQPNYQQPNYQNSYYRDEYRQAANPAYTQPQKQSSMALASLIMGIIGIVTSCCCYGGVIFGSLGILFALLSKMGDTMEGYAKAGLITSIIALFLAAMAMIFLFGMMSSSLLSGGAF
ncbi:hypothetical protein [Hungatella sp.]|uniref:hypothetical protein n=1 Tax=Hungatella sp. TaxID=2613924 RepID=UPI002A8243A9|nr:hypothetical protein [Hungatella sp.]